MKVTRMLNCPFTTEELKEIGIQLALANQKRERLEDDKKQSMSQFKSELDAAEAQIKSLAQKLARGSEDRSIDCDVLYNTPTEGTKTIVRGDTGETVQIVNMTDGEINDLFINNLGAHKDTDEFVFRDKSRAKMIHIDKFNQGRDEAKFNRIGGYTEKELVDAKPESIDCVLIVYSLDEKTKSDFFEVYKFIAPVLKALPRADDSKGDEYE